MRNYKSFSSSSSDGDKFIRPEKIEQIYASNQRSPDLFDLLLDDAHPSLPTTEDIKRAVAELNLSPRMASEHGCKCSKIDCLKLYCECFAKGRTCNENCICTGCHNKTGNEGEIYKAKQVVNYKHPNYFRGVPAFVPPRRCTCKKSLCMKKYCECYNAGYKCTEDCECFNCHNGKPELDLSFDSRMEIEVNA